MQTRTQVARRAKREPVAGLLAAILFWTPSTPGLAQDGVSIAGGRREFLQHCAICHGKDGHGKGALAEQLKIQPADLTRIRKRNGGEFPFWSIYRFIDGREEIKEKGDRVMPVWGDEFHKEAGSNNPEAESQIRTRILKLVYYLQSIQEE